MAIFDITYIGDMPYLKLEGGTVTGATTFNSSITANSASITNNLAVGSINGVTVGSSPKFTDTVTTTTMSGSGNAVTEITASNGALTITKGTSFSVSTHTHGNITNAGDITATATIASGDRLVINDESASKITNSSITFGTDTSKFLRNDGTWASVSSVLPNIYYKGTITALSAVKWRGASVNLSNYVLFAGGMKTSSTYSNVVDAYNSSLTRSTPTALSVSRDCLAGARVGSYALFAGGYGNSASNVVDAYNSSLTRSTPTALSSSRISVTGATVDNYALFAGGGPNFASNEKSTTVDAYNSSLTRSTPTALSEAMAPVGISTSNYAFFGGCCNNYVPTSTVNVYNTSLTRSVLTTLSNSAVDMFGGNLGNYACFAGGRTKKDNAFATCIDVYNSSLSQMTAALTFGKSTAASASILTDYILFAGGYTGDSKTTQQLDAMDKSLTVKAITSLSQSKQDLLGGSIGGYAIFAGGYNKGNGVDTVEAYTLF